MKRRLLELVGVATVVFVLHLGASLVVSMWSYVDYNSGSARFLWSVLRFPEDTPEVLPDGYRQLLKPHWPEIARSTILRISFSSSSTVFRSAGGIIQHI